MLSMEYCTGLFVWGPEVCAHLVVGGVSVAGVSGRAKNTLIKSPFCIKLVFQDKQSMCDVTMRRVFLTIVAVGKQQVSLILSVCL